MGADRKRATRARCGVYDCSACDLFLDKRCPGCNSENLRIAHEGDSPCAVYACVRGLGVDSCSECSLLSCRLSEWPPSRCPLRARYGGKTVYRAFRHSLEAAKGTALVADKKAPVPKRAIGRVRWYLQAMEEYARRGVATISSHHLARAAGVRSSLVRRDLSELGHFGTPGRGYRVPTLRRAIRRRLRLEETRPVLWLGAERLKRDPAARQALADMNCHLLAVFDSNPKQVGATVAGLRVLHLADAAEQAGTHGDALAVLASEEAAEAELLQALAGAGVRAFLNLTSVPVTAPAGTVVEQADLGSQLFRLLCRLGPAAASRSGAKRAG
jgi:redox-sensing transcriptional repressor